MTKDCNEYFILFSHLIKLYRENYIEKNSDIKYMNLMTLTKRFIERLQGLKHSEKPGALLEDKIIVGYLSVIKELFQNVINNYPYETLLELVQETGFIDELFHQCLFYSREHTKGDNQNKCKHKKTRVIAY